MIIGVTLDDVIRAKTLQVGKAYKKFVDPSIDLDGLEFNTDNLMEVFGLDDADAWNKFMYEDCAFEIFGSAGTCSNGLGLNFNKWLLDLSENEEDVKVIVTNPFEFNLSIPFTNFFLSKVAIKARDYFFPLDSSEIWDKCDVVVTASTKLIESKPDGKVCVRIDMPYNEDMMADFTYDTFEDVLDDNEFIKIVREQLCTEK